ncbi:MAG: hypothetical protein MZV70_20075 [Desulfobacterales bacterium]|nr:hypothetical protein [Desulfobacterales bacterium]
MTPVFLLAHIVLWDEAWNLSWWALPDGLAVVMTAGRHRRVRLLLHPAAGSTPEVAYVTSASDYVILRAHGRPVRDGPDRLFPVVRRAALHAAACSDRGGHARSPSPSRGSATCSSHR